MYEDYLTKLIWPGKLNIYYLAKDKWNNFQKNVVCLSHSKHSIIVAATIIGIWYYYYFLITIFCF